MRQNRWVWQIVICLTIFSAIQNGIGSAELERYENFASLIEKITEAIHENYTLAELLQIGEEAATAVVSAPARISEMIVAANEQSFYGQPMSYNEDTSELVQPVYSSAGGRVLKSGIRDGIGLYVMVEHENKISTYGHLSSVRVVEGERVQKGEILGSYHRSNEHDFYYSLEEKN